LASCVHGSVNQFQCDVLICWHAIVTKYPYRGSKVTIANHKTFKMMTVL
jgi:hypothetical protein